MAQLSNRYATALFSLALERGPLQEGLEQAVFLLDALSDSKCQNLITHPRISAIEKKNFFDTVFKGQLSGEMLGFLHLAVAKNREAFIVPALEEFIEMAKQHLRQTTATVISAAALGPNEVSALAALLSRKLDKQVEIDVKVDSSLIGGLYIQVDGYSIDRTIKTRLKEMKKTMGGEAAVVV